MISDSANTFKLDFKIWNHACGEFDRFIRREKDLEKCKLYHRLLIKKFPKTNIRSHLLLYLRKSDHKIWFQEEIHKQEVLFLAELLIDPDNLDLINDIAQFYRFYVRDYEKAILFYRKIFLIDPTFECVAFRLALCYKSLNQYEKGIQVYDTYIKIIEDQKYINKQLKYKRNKKAWLEKILDSNKDYYRYRGHLKFKLGDVGYIKDYLISS